MRATRDPRAQDEHVERSLKDVPGSRRLFAEYCFTEHSYVPHSNVYGKALYSTRMATGSIYFSIICLRSGGPCTDAPAKAVCPKVMIRQLQARSCRLTIQRGDYAPSNVLL